MILRPPLLRVVSDLLSRVPRGAAISLDALGDALGTLAVSQDEIDAVMRALEREGRKIVGPQGQHGESTLRTVLFHARELREETGKTPTAEQIADASGLDVERVRHALALARVIAK